MSLFTRLVVFAALAVGYSTASYAQQSNDAAAETTGKLDKVLEKTNTVSGNIDEEITNAKLRAESGSKSKYSFSTRLDYTGGSFTRAFGVQRPDLSGVPGNQTETSASIGLDGRYRMTKNDSVTLGTSFAMMTPFQGNVGDTGTQLNVFDPNLAYNRAFAGLGLQQTASVILTVGTSKETQDIDKNGSLTLSHNGLKEFKNGLSVGIATDLSYNSYNSAPGKSKNERTVAPGYYGGDRRQEWSLAFYPYGEYAINDRYAIRTVFGYLNFQHLYGDNNAFRLLKQKSYQSVGLGIAVTRDVYLYPNVQFVPDNIRSDFTNLAFNATINIF